MTRLVALALFGVVALLGVAVAAGKYDGHFDDIDKNGDKIIVKEEFVEFFKANGDPAGAFVLIDVDKSGGIDHDEWHAFKKAHGYGHKDDEHAGDKK